MSAANSPAPEAPPQPPQKNPVAKGCAGCLSIILLVYGLGCISQWAGCNQGGSPSAVSSLPTKAQWRSQHPKALFLQIGRASLKGYLGEPASIQRTGGTEYWRYECQDGSIQLVVSNPTMGDMDLVVTAVNEY